MEANKKFQITGNVLKVIAVITMLIDHFAYGIYLTLAYEKGWTITLFGKDIYEVMRLVGRLAFPIYCFLLVEGYFHTRNYRKYALRLLILAMISEFPFDLAINFYNSYFAYNNVIFTLLIGLLTIGGIDYIQKGNVNFLTEYWTKSLGMAAVFVAGCFLAYFMHTDYGMGGVTAIVVMYYTYGQDRIHYLISFALGVVILALCGSATELAALVVLIPIYFYNGKRGSNSIILRRVLNWFYPAHLLIIGIIAYMIF